MGRTRRMDGRRTLLFPYLYSCWLIIEHRGVVVEKDKSFFSASKL